MALGLVTAACAGQPTLSSDQAARLTVPVTHVVDGDTIRVVVGGRAERVRLIGLDAPEIEHPPQPAECFGPAAFRFTRRTLDGRSVSLEFDVRRRDRFGRLLAYVFHRGRLFNRTLVSRGFAVEHAYPPNLARQDELRLAEEAARRNGRGLWGACEG
jgi:micrococcal nuclease